MQVNNQNDPHHCHCFILHPSYHDEFKQHLDKLEFKDPLLQMNRGQKFGLTKRLDEETQIHVKQLENGVIEAEMEYPSDYPMAHLNPEHSYSAHNEIEQILNQGGFSYTRKIVPPITCVKRIIKKAIKPTHINTILAGIAVVSAIGVSAYLINKELKK